MKEGTRKRPHIGIRKKDKDRKDESNEGDQDGRNKRKTQKGHNERLSPTEGGTKPWRRTKEKERTREQHS